MLSLFQKTILKEVSFKGIGLHNGLKSQIRILPASENSGIVFKRTDLDKNNLIKANFENVGDLTTDMTCFGYLPNQVICSHPVVTVQIRSYIL